MRWLRYGRSCARKHAEEVLLFLGVSSDSILFGTESETVLDALTDRCRVLSKEQFSILTEIVEKYIEAVSL